MYFKVYYNLCDLSINSTEIRNKTEFNAIHIMCVVYSFSFGKVSSDQRFQFIFLSFSREFSYDLFDCFCSHANE